MGLESVQVKSHYVLKNVADVFNGAPTPQPAGLCCRIVPRSLTIGWPSVGPGRSVLVTVLFPGPHRAIIGSIMRTNGERMLLIGQTQGKPAGRPLEGLLSAKCRVRQEYVTDCGLRVNARTRVGVCSQFASRHARGEQGGFGREERAPDHPCGIPVRDGSVMHASEHLSGSWIVCQTPQNRSVRAFYTTFGAADGDLPQSAGSWVRTEVDSVLGRR